MPRKLVCCALALISLSLALPASAQDAAAADVLFREGKDLVDAGRIGEACPKFQASLEIAPALGTLLNLADCLERDGKLASAEERWNEAVDTARAASDSREAFASERLAALVPRVPHLLLEVTSGSEPLSIAVLGRPLAESRYGLPIALDPGKVAVTVLRGEVVLETREVALSEASQTRLALDLERIARAHPVPRKVVPEPARPEQRIAGFVVLSVGLAGMSAFGVLEAIAISQSNEAKGGANCKAPEGENLVCSPQGLELVESAQTLAEVGQWLGVGGLALTGVGLTLVLTAPSGGEESEAQPAELSATLAPMVGPGQLGLSLRGQF